MRSVIWEEETWTVFSSREPMMSLTITPVSYTHLDVYKRQLQYTMKIRRDRKNALVRQHRELPRSDSIFV